jgi:DNA helicase-4
MMFHFLKKLDPFYWLERRLTRKGTRCQTLKGEWVKSKIEKRIADSLFKQGIRYVYEPKLRVWFFTNIRPDFYLPDYDVYVEYHGLLEHPEKGAAYRRAVEYKQKHYDRLKKRVIALDHRQASHIETALYEALKKLK